MEGKKRDAPVAYIASPLSGDVAGNIERTKEYSRFAISKGAVQSGCRYGGSRMNVRRYDYGKDGGVQDT